MAVHRTLNDLSNGPRKSAIGLLADGEQLVAIVHHTPRFTPAVIHQYIPYYIVTDRRFIKLQRASNGRDKITDVRFSEVTRVKHTPKHVTGKSEIELSGAGIRETITLPQEDGEALDDILRTQLAEQKQPA